METAHRHLNHASNYFIPENAFPLLKRPVWIDPPSRVEFVPMSEWGIRRMAHSWQALPRSANRKARAWALLSLWVEDVARAVVAWGCEHQVWGVIQETPHAVQESFGRWLNHGWDSDRVALMEVLWRLEYCPRTVSAARALHRMAEGLDPWDSEGSGTFVPAPAVA